MNRHSNTEAVRASICGSVEMHDLPNGVTKIVTPFVDWKGARIAVFVRANGEITDGGSVLSQMRSLRTFDTYQEWAHRGEFLLRYNMTESDGALLPTTMGEGEEILSYIQGLGKLPTYFEAQPIRDNADNYPQVVKDNLRGLLSAYAPRDDLMGTWVEKRLVPKEWPYNGFPLQTDLTPKSPDLMVQIISHATASQSIKKQHIQAKLLPYAMIRGKKKGLKLVGIVSSKDYPPTAWDILEHEASEIVFVRDEDDSTGLSRAAEILGTQAPALSSGGH